MQRGWGENWSPLLQSNHHHSFSLSLCFSASRSSFSSSPLPDALPLSLSLSLIFFYFSFEALFNFCRGIFPVHSDYYSQEMEEENRSRELLWCKGVVTATTRGEKRFEEIVWKFLDNSVGRALYAIFWRFFPSLAQGKFSLNSTLSPLLSSIKIQNGRV